MQQQQHTSAQRYNQYYVRLKTEELGAADRTEPDRKLEEKKESQWARKSDKQCSNPPRQSGRYLLNC